MNNRLKFEQLLNKLFLLAYILFVPFVVSAQSGINNDKLYPAILPPSPNAAELGRVGNIPIDYSTGAINYNIPMLSITSGKLKLDVNLRYSAGGIKVDQIASRAGLGWVLEAGGVINRTVYGDPDEKSLYVNAPANLNANTQEVRDFLERVSRNKDGYDTQPDIFSFNFAGHAGKFILNPADKSQVIFISRSNLKVVTNFNHIQGNGWTLKVIDPNGVSYYFGGTVATEKSRNSNSGSNCGRTYDTGIETAWYLNKIEDVNGDQLLLNYLPCNFSYAN